MQRSSDHGSIPDGWQRVRLGDVADFQQGGTPAKANQAYWDGDIPFVTGADLGHRRIGRDSARSFLTEWGMNSGSTVFCNAGDLLLATRTRVGLVGIASEMLGASQDITLVEPTDAANCSFLYRVLDSRADELLRKSRGTTIQGITREDVQGLPILLPPLPEQRAIAAVLDSIDDAIEGAEAVIAATEGLRDALLHDLLTRGLPGQHTEFRDVSGLGTIPADWEVVRLGDVAEVTSGLAVGPHRIPQNNPRPYLTVANVQAGQVNIDENRLMEVAESEYKSRTLRAGDVVLVEGHAQISQLGRAAIIPPEAEGFTFQNHLFRVRKGELSDARFIAAYVNSQGGRRYFGSFGGTTSGLNTVSAASVKALPLPLPSLAEQQAIAAALDGVDGAAKLAREELAGLRLLKESTADALLTGRVRAMKPTALEGSG